MKIEKNLLIAAINDIETLTTQFDFKGTYTDVEGATHNVTVFDTEYFIDCIRRNYFARYMFLDSDGLGADLIKAFRIWKTSRANLYLKQAYAYTIAYNPIENYSSVEVMDRTDELTKETAVTREYDHDKVERTHTQDTITRTYSQDKIEREYIQDKVERTNTDNVITTEYNQVKDETKNKRYGINSSTAVNTDETDNTRTGNETVTTEGSYADTHTGKYADTHTGSYDDTHTGSYADEHTGGYSDTNSGTDTTETDYTLTRHGNIGVKTASEMLQAEYEGLAQDLANRALCDFLDRYTWYVGGDE